MGDKPHPSQSNRVHSKAVSSLHENTATTEPCQEFLLCKQQLNTAFDCIPLSAIKTYQGPVIAWRKYLCNYFDQQLVDLYFILQNV